MIGTNSLAGNDITSANSFSCGLYCYGALSITGGGSLNSIAGNSTLHSAGLFAKDGLTIDSNVQLTVKGDTVAAASGDHGSYGLLTDGSLNISGASKVDATGELANKSYGIYFKTASTISTDGYVRATGGDLSYAIAASSGIYADGNLTISGKGECTAKGGNVSGGATVDEGSFGIAYKVAVINSTGTVNAIGGTDSNNKSYGFYHTDDTGSLTINSGIVTAKGKTRATGEQFTDRSPVLSKYTNCFVTASANFDGSSPVTTYIPANIATYKYLKISLDIDKTTTDLKSEYELGLNAVKPAFTVNYTPADSALIKNTDYTVTYGDNNALGQGTVTITGIGKFANTKTFTFNIIPNKINENNLTVTGINNSYQLGSNPDPSKVVVSFNGAQLTEGTDYVVTFGDNNAIGTGTVTITGKGNYSGSKTVHFTIYAKAVYVIIPKISGVSVTPGFGLNLSSIGSSFDFTITPDANLGKEGIDYTITVRTDRGETLSPTGNNYKIAFVDHETTIYITVTRLTTAIESINPFMVYGGYGNIIIQSPTNASALVVNMTGQAVKNTKIVSGKTVFSGLQKGIYIVKVGEKVTKVIVR